MRHGISGNKLGRNTALRKATVRDIAKATLIRQRICTTKAKAKEARKLVDHLITLGKKGSLSHKRRAFSILCDHKLVSSLFNKMAPRFLKRNGGYTRIIPLSYRRGDSAQMVYLELTEKEEVVVSKSKSSATAKKKILKSQETQPQQEQAKEEVKKEGEVEKVEKQTKVLPKHGKDKTQVSKKVVSGIKKMFRRKTAE